MYNSTDKIEVRKVRDFGQTIDISIAFVQQNFKPLLRSIITIALPPFIIFFTLGYFLFFFVYISNIGNGSFSQDFSYLSLLSLLLIIIGNSTVVATIYQYLLLYIEVPDYKSINLGLLSKKVFKNLSLFIATTIQLALFIGLIIFFLSFILITLIAIFPPVLSAIAMFGLFLFFTYFIFCLSIVYIIRAVEKNSFLAAVSRCFYLVKENWWKTFSIFFISTFIYFSLIMLLSLLILFVGAVLGTLNWDETIIGSILVILQIIYSSIQITASMIIFLVIAFHYFSLVEEKEGVGLLAKIKHMGNTISN